MNIEDLFIKDLNDSCELIDLSEPKGKSRKEEVRSKKHAIIYFIAKKYKYFIDTSLYPKIAFYFGMERTTMNHICKTVDNALDSGLQYPVVRYYKSLFDNIGLYGVANIKAVCIKTVANVYKSEKVLMLEIRKIHPDEESFIILVNDTAFEFSNDEKRKEYFKYIRE